MHITAECWIQVVQEITEELEAKLMEEQMNYTQLQTQRDEMAREFEEVKVQLEEDADRCACFPLCAMTTNNTGTKPQGNRFGCCARYRQLLQFESVH